jgi:hypothetical protein
VTVYKGYEMKNFQLQKWGGIATLYEAMAYVIGIE